MSLPTHNSNSMHPALVAAGFHSYVQDVAPTNAGLVLAVTNTCGTLVGIGGNLATGHLAASRWGYAGVGWVVGGEGGVWICSGARGALEHRTAGQSSAHIKQAPSPLASSPCCRSVCADGGAAGGEWFGVAGRGARQAAGSAQQATSGGARQGNITLQPPSHFIRQHLEKL